MNQNLDLQVMEMFLSVFPQLSEERIRTIKRNDFADWDSLKQIEIVTEIEEGFEIEIDDSSVSNIQDFESAVELVRSLL
jgi:acyl carrier protein